MTMTAVKRPWAGTTTNYKVTVTKMKILSLSLTNAEQMFYRPLTDKYVPGNTNPRDVSPRPARRAPSMPSDNQKSKLKNISTHQYGIL
jgi:hypothetical protein